MPTKFIKKRPYRHCVTGDDINQYPRQPSLKFFFACVLGGFVPLVIAVKI
ncbi:MAG: hypothetical protein ACRCUG_04065 [Yersinia sp. (in: enterobacteria)]